MNLRSRDTAFRPSAQAYSEPAHERAERQSYQHVEASSANPGRRAFLQQSAGGLLATGMLLGSAAAGVAMAGERAQPQPNFDEPLPPEKRLGWAIVGLGDFATKQIMPSFGACQRSRLAAFVSGDRDKAKKFGEQYGVSDKHLYDYKSFDKLIDDETVDVVYIILPNGMHAEYTIRAAEAGKHVMCEKPMANSVEDCQRMITACEKADRRLMIAYRAQFETFNQAAIKLAQTKELGTLKSIIADHGRILNPKEKRDQWRTKRDLAGGGSLVDIGIYSLQAARYLTGEEPTEVQAMIHSPRGDSRFAEVEETVHFMLKFPSGVLANCTSSYGWNQVKRYRVIGDQGWCDLDPATAYSGNRMKHGFGDESKSRVEQVNMPEKNQFAREIDHLSECIATKKTPYTPGQEGLQDVKIMHAIYEAAANGQRVKIS